MQGRGGGRKKNNHNALHPPNIPKLLTFNPTCDLSWRTQQQLSLVVTQDRDDFVRYSNDVLRARQDQLLTEVSAAAAARGPIFVCNGVCVCVCA